MSEEKNYNDTVNALISSMLISAYEKMDKELIRGTDNRTALAMAIADSIRSHIEIMSIESVISREALNHVMHDKGFVSHQEKRCFMALTDDIYKSGHYRKRTFNLGYEIQTRLQIGVFKLPNEGSER